jgi:hypothetical protein
MRVTTSRKPSPGTRRLAKTLATFLGRSHVTRGKLNLNSDDVWLVVAEQHGNPGSLVKRMPIGEEMLSFTVSFEKRVQKLKRDQPVVVGSSKRAEDLARFFDLNWDPTGKATRIIKVTDERLEFIDQEEIILRLKI